MFSQLSIQRGKAWANLPESTMLGRPYFLPNNLTASDNPMIKNRRFGGGNIVMVAQNDSGSTLAAKRVVTWDTASWRQEVEGYGFAGGERVAGVIDDQIGSRGVLNGEYFLLFMTGQVICTTPSSTARFGSAAAIAIGDTIEAAVGTSATHADAGRVRVSHGANGGTTYARIAGGAAGDHTVTGIALTDRLVCVIHETPGATTADLTSEFTITAANTINNAGGTATGSDVLHVFYEDYAARAFDIGTALAASSTVDADILCELNLPWT